MIKRFIILCTFSLFIHSTNTYSFQVEHTSNNQGALLRSLENELKSPSYRTETLPNDFSYISNLISHGCVNNQPPSYLRSVIKLFSNLLKGSEYVNASAAEKFMHTFPEDAQHYFDLPVSRAYFTNVNLCQAHMFDRFKATVNNILYVKFSSEYESFRNDPSQFLSYITSDILEVAQEEVTREQLRQGIIRFLEITLSKLIWNATAPEKSWQTTKNIANQLATLLECNILEDSNDLDDLYWTLLTRYCYFIDITATDTQPSFFTMIKNDIALGGNPLFELQEQDPIVESKLSYMQRTLFSAEAHSRAYYINITKD